MFCSDGTKNSLGFKVLAISIALVRPAGCSKSMPKSMTVLFKADIWQYVRPLATL
jgi:hypothetical protein